MRPRSRVVTLAVADLERALAFYREGLGLASSGIIATRATSRTPTAISGRSSGTRRCPGDEAT